MINNYGSNCTKVKLRHSNFHMSLVPNNSALDKYILQEVVVEFCRKNDLTFFRGSTPFKCVVIYNADNLSEQAQFSLRRVMETTARLCRFILLSTNPCNFIAPIRSRFIQVNVPTLTTAELELFLRQVAEKEGVAVTDDLSSDRDTKTALWKLESKRHGVEYCCWWEKVVDEIASIILDCPPAQSMAILAGMRDRIGMLFVSNIESSMVVVRLMKTLLLRLGDDCSLQMGAAIAETFACFDCRLKNATRYILHMEALVHHLAWIVHGGDLTGVATDALL